MKQAIFIGLILAAVLLSGCVQQPPITPPGGGPPTQPGGTDGITEAEISGVKLSIADVTLNDNRDQITDIRILVNPIESDASRSWKVKPALEKDGIREISYETLPRLSFSNINAPTKITLQNFYAFSWDPTHAMTGDYTLIIEILNPNTEEKLATITKPISMQPNAPKVQ